METIYLSLRAQVAVGTFFMKSLVPKIYHRNYLKFIITITKVYHYNYLKSSLTIT